MKIGIVSDTHDHQEAAMAAFRALEAEGIHHALHLGDLIAPFTLKAIRKVYSGELEVIFGNNDGERFLLTRVADQLNIRIGPGPRVLELDGLRVLMTHEPVAPEALAKSGDFDLILYGHTHQVDLREIGKAIVLNPGEACGYLSGRKTYAVFDTATRKVEIRDLVT